MNQTVVFSVSGMSCAHCETRIQTTVLKIPGVSSARASFSRHRVEVTFDPERATEAAIRGAITSAGYQIVGEGRTRQPIAKVIPVALILLAVYLLLRYTTGFDFLGFIPKIDSTVSLAALFVTGLFTSVHCVAMCGGINLSQSVSSSGATKNALRNPLLYNLGRVISYTLIGALVGGLGSVLFFSETVKAILLIAAALGMLLMGLGMLGWLPWWLVPRVPAFLAVKAGKAGAGKGPLVVGLLNGLMPCGPLQAMQLYALATGSALTGSLSMLLFSLGTVPLMLGAGVAFSALKGKFTYVIQRVSAVLVVCFAVVMASSALSLIGVRGQSSNQIDPAPAAPTAAAKQEETQSLLQQALDKGYLPATVQDGVQTVQADLSPSGYPFIIVQKGIPVQFSIQADESAITGCNQTVVFPAYNVKKTLQPGANVIEFTPDETGIVPYTCWMGMQPGRILVVDDLNTANAK